ncbi:hypothetical protein HHI36_021173 [Cryptolaemus montrouzieri]|uniref:Uncharacterized protein n=1 Tax=Cryptolaemus montrouzieri TaxID=559131 RepID=A0ABD2MW39_9CUCU
MSHFSKITNFVAISTQFVESRRFSIFSLLCIFGSQITKTFFALYLTSNSSSCLEACFADGYLFIPVYMSSFSSFSFSYLTRFNSSRITSQIHTDLRFILVQKSLNLSSSFCPISKNMYILKDIVESDVLDSLPFCPTYSRCRLSLSSLMLSVYHSHFLERVEFYLIA